MTCREVRPELWEHARQVLVFYFSRRHQLSFAEDLAQETLATLWARDDYEFQKEDEFLRVCYGFASRVLQQGYRQSKKHSGPEPDPSLPAPTAEMSGLRGVEIGIFLDEVRRLGKAELSGKEWQLVEQAATEDRSKLIEQLKLNNSGNLRVHLHRARNKLAKITGWPGR